MPPFVRPFVLASVVSAGASLAMAQDLGRAPNPFRAVPNERVAMAAPAGEADRVFGGRDAAEGEFPYQVALLKASSLTTDPESQYEAQFCGGTLVAADWVLTAAHCMMDGDRPLEADAFDVLTGSTDLMKGTISEVKAVFVNPSYDPYSMDHDVALVQLRTPLDLPVVGLDLDGTSFERATVVGWGLTEGGEYPRYLQKSDLEVVPNTQCNIGIKGIYAANLKRSVADLGAQYRIKDDEVARIGEELSQGIADPLTGSMICAGLVSGQRDACYGDSGGPLIAIRAGKPVQLGIVSWGEGPADSDIKCGHKDVFGVYSRVASFADWISSHIEGK